MVKLTQAIKKLAESDVPLRYTDVDLSKKPDRQPLLDLGLIEVTKLPSKTGKMPKNPNAVKITTLGKLFLRYSDDQRTKANDMLNEVSTHLSKTTAQIETISEELTYIRKEVEKINSFLKNSTIVFKPVEQMSDEEFLKIVKKVYKRTPKQLGDMVPIHILRKEISNLTGLNHDEIDRKLYSLFLDIKIELQRGKRTSDETPLIAPNGVEFYWFKPR